MHDDDELDDTVLRVPRHARESARPDVDDTVIRVPRARAAEIADPAEPLDLEDTVLRAPRVSGADVSDTVLRAPRVTGADVSDTVLRPRSQRSGPTAPPTGSTVPASPVVPVPPAPRPEPTRVASVRIRGEVVPLDRPVVIGRAPSGPRIALSVPPRLVTVPSPGGQVSSTHVAIRSEGAVVVVEDLRSTNGTFVRVPGAAPLRMRAGASMVVLTGTVVDIGDGTTIEILSPHLRLRPDDPAAGLPGAPPPGALPPRPESHTS